MDGVGSFSELNDYDVDPSLGLNDYDVYPSLMMLLGDDAFGV